MENIRNFVYGTEFEVSDHKEMKTILKDNSGNRTSSSRQIRWVDGLLPFQCRLVLAQGGIKGISDILIDMRMSPSRTGK